jgi:prepilin-type N-terminal cleavage/methylation domain-containing protein
VSVRPIIGTARTPWRRHAQDNPGENGFTLIEMVIVALVLPILIGAITLALISVFSLQNGVRSRISDSGDAQTVSANFERDVQSAAMLTTSSSVSPMCGTGAQLLGLEWSPNQAGGYQSIVSYVGVANGTTTSENLVRQYCSAGASSVPTSSSLLAYDVPLNQLSPTITPSSISAQAASAWVSTEGVTGVTFAITEPGSGYSYSLVALPGASSPPSVQSTPTAATTSCGFATPGTGTYASTLCFVDFSPLNSTGTQCATGGLKVTAGIVNTPYAMTFCVSISGASAAPAVIPTYFAPPTSEAFLGNNGFYTGIPGDPALYQTSSGTTTVTITNIQVLDSNGSPATGWQLVSGDAESTDAGESITWTAGWSAQSTLSASQEVLSLLPDSPTSQIGNACAAPTPANPAAIDLTGVGTKTVECAATVSSDKTGTVILEAPAPTTLTVQMVGTGLQAIFIGMLLP